MDKPLCSPQRSASEPQALNLYSMHLLEYRLRLSREHLRLVAKRAFSYYSPFTRFKDPRPFAKKKRTIKARVIDRPTGDLKAIQARISKALLGELNMPDYIVGGVKGRSVLDNVQFHLNETIVVTFDIKNWFPSITSEHVYRVWRELLNCSPRIATLLTNLTTFENHLPQGAPTSTALANLVLFSIDQPIRVAAGRLGVNYSAFVDDLSLSGRDARALIPIVVGTFKNAGFQISRAKLHVMGATKIKTINGVVLGGGPRASHAHRSRLRSGVNKLRLGLVTLEQRVKYTESLVGRIIHLKSIDPRYGGQLHNATIEALGKVTHPKRQGRSRNSRTSS